MRQSRLLIILSFFALSLLVGGNALRAQATIVLPCSAIAVSYGIDSTLATDSTRLAHWLRAQPDTSYSNLSTQCALMNTKVQHMLSSLRNTYAIRHDTLWLDSTTCITDYAPFSAKLSQLSQRLFQKSAEYDQKEQARLLTAIKVAEAKARAKARAEQSSRNDSLSIVKETIDSLHRTISRLCNNDEAGDKSQTKRRKDLYYCYLSLYNKYDLSLSQANSRQLQQLKTLVEVQHDIADSMLGSHSYEVRIAQFSDRLKQRCASAHKEISKSYIRTFRNVEVPVRFGSIPEYYTFTQQLKDILTVQQAYLKVVELCEEIERGGNKVIQQAARHKAVQSSYKAAVGMVDMLPLFTTVAESEKFIGKLNMFIEVQKKYFSVMQHMDSIDARGQRVMSLCGKGYGDLVSAYKELVAAYDFAPSFTTLEGAAFYDKTLDDFEVLQDTYIRLLDLRQLISMQDKQIMDDDNLPREVKAGYKLMKDATKMKPNFSTVARGELFVDSMKLFIAMQDEVRTIADKQKAIDDNIKQMKNWNKANGNTVHAYTILRNEMKQEFIITNPDDLENYKKYQDRQLHLQERFIDVIKSNERIDYNKRLKGLRDADKIRLIMNM